MRNSIKAYCAASVTIGLSIAVGPASAGGMMGGGMMGGGMMGHGSDSSSSQNQESSSPAVRKLLGYVDSNGLACLGCHNVSSRSTGPAFMDIAKRYAGNDGAQSALAGSIADGTADKWADYPAMPGGLASPEQARKLAALILSLAPRSHH